MRLTVLVLLSGLMACSAITTNQISTLKRIISTNIFQVLGGRSQATAVRLAFHDCVGPTGCDGCVNLGLADNAGLETVYNRVKEVYNDATLLTDEQRGLLTFADWVALVGVRAVELTMGNLADTVTLDFKTGRPHTTDCPDPYNQNEFPDAKADYDDTVSFLKTQFNLADDYEAIVLLGAHTLGGATAEFSGFSGPWTATSNALNNEYYQVLEEAVTDHWEQIIPKKNDPSSPQWQLPDTAKRSQRRLIEILANLLSESERKKRQAATTPRLMMLNCDMALYRDINVDANGDSSCASDVATCAVSPGSNSVTTLANDNVKFVTDFASVFTKMTEKVPDGTTLVAATVSASKKDVRKKALREILEGLLEVVEEDEK